MFKALVFGPAAALIALAMSAAPILASSQVGSGSLYLDGRVVSTVVPPASVPEGSGTDPFYKVTNAASGQLGVAGTGPGNPGTYHGGSWQVWMVTFNAGVTPYLLTSAAAVAAAQAAGDVTVTRAPDADFRCPITEQNRE